MNLLPSHRTKVQPQSIPQPIAREDRLSASSETETFDPGWRFFASFASLCIVTLAVALDATSLSVALPVRNTCPSHYL